MRNILKRSERHNRSRRPNRGVSAIAASIASAALVAGLGSYPVGAQDTTVPSSSSVSSEVARSTVTEPDTSAPDTSVPASSAWPSSVEAPSGPVQVSRTDDIDRIVIDDPDGEVWGYGAKASMEDIFGITRSGSGEIEEILKVTIDGEELDPQFFGFVNDTDGGVLAFDLDALNEIPPRHVEFEVRTAASATYVIAESDEVPTAKDLNAQSTYGKTADAAATVNPNASGTVTINGQPRNSGSTTTEAPQADGPLSGEYKLPLAPARLSTAPGKVLTSELLGNLTRQDVYPTRLRITYSGAVDNRTTSLSGPVTLTKNGNETCTVQNPRPVETKRQPRGTAVVTAIEIDLRSCPQKFWEGNGDTISVKFNGPGGASGDYAMEMWGRREQPNSGGQPNPNDGVVDSNGKCVSDDPETKVQPRQGKRTITDEEKRRGTETYVSTSAAANGDNKDRRAMTHTLLSVQQQGSNQFVPVGSSNWIYNGLGYNPDDNWLYGISQHRGSSGNPDPCYPAGHLLQIDPVTGAVRDLGEVKNGGASPFKDQNGARDRTLINTGVFYNNNLYVSNSATSGSRDIYRVVLPAVGSSNPTGTNRGFKGYSEDYAVLPQAPQYAWGIVSAGAYRELGFGYSDSNGWHNSNGVYIERINLATGTVDRWELLGFEKRANFLEALEKKATWGKAWTYGNGNLGFAQGGDSANQANPGVQISITNPGARRPNFNVVGLLNQVPESYNTDATSNARREPPSESDLAVEKVAISKEDGKTYPGFDKDAMDGERTYWAIRVTNLGPDTSPGAVVTDVVPSAYEDVKLMSEYRTQKDGFETLVQLSPNTRQPSASGLIGTGQTDVQYILGAMQQGDEVWMYLSAKLKNRQQCVPNTASVVNNDIDPNPGNNTDQSGCPPIVEIHKKFVGDAKNGSHLVPIVDPDGTKKYRVQYQIKVTNMTAAEVWYQPPIDEIFVPQGMTLTKATSVYTNEWGNKKLSCSIDGANAYLKPADFKSNATTRFRLQDCRKEDSEYKGFDGRLFEDPSENRARDLRHIDAAKTERGRVVTGSHTYDVTAEFKLDEAAYLNAYPSYAQDGGVCNAEMGGLVNQAWMGETPSELPCTTPPIDKPSLKVKKVAGDRREENLSNSGVEFTVYKSNGGKLGDKEAGLIPDGDALRTDGKLSYDQDYFLVETRAPEGFSLLTEPIPFKIVKDNGNAKVVIANSSVMAEAGESKGSLAVMTVANIRQGNLPETGGMGVQLPALLGAALVAAGAFLGRRRMAQ